MAHISKKLKLEVNELILTTTITDLCAHCLDMIFDYLDKSDIVNVAEANLTSYYSAENNENDFSKDKINRLKESLRRAYRRKMKPQEKVVVVSINVDVAPDHIILLRHFGQEFNGLRVKYCSYENRRYEKALEDAVINYCRKTLPRIEFEDCDPYSMNEIQEPFPNVQYVTFHKCHLGSRLGQLHKWFPLMKSLEFQDTIISDPECIHQRFPSLEMLTVWNPRRGRDPRTPFSNLNLKFFAIINPQLRYLHIRHDDVDESESGSNAIIVNSDFMSFISKNLQLKYLILNLENYKRIEKEWQSMVAFENLIGLEIRLKEFCCLGNMRLTSPTLQNLILKGSTSAVINYKSIANFIRGTKPKILKIQVGSNTFDMRNTHIIGIVSSQSNLKQVFIECLWNYTLPDAMITFLCHSTMITKVVGLIKFVRDNGGNPSYGRLEQIYRDKIIQNELVANKWTYTFDNSVKSNFYYVLSVTFVKII